MLLAYEAVIVAIVLLAEIAALGAIGVAHRALKRESAEVKQSWENLASSYEELAKHAEAVAGAADEVQRAARTETAKAMIVGYPTGRQMH